MKKVWSIISGIVVAVAGGIKVVSAFSGNEITCDSDTTRQLVQQIGQDNIRNDAASAEAFSADRSTFTLSDIKQDAETEGGVRCSATLTAQLDWSDALAGMKAQDAAGFDAALAEKGLTGATDQPVVSQVSYTVEEAEGNMVQVEVTTQPRQAKNN